MSSRLRPRRRVSFRCKCVIDLNDLGAFHRLICTFHLHFPSADLQRAEAAPHSCLGHLSHLDEGQQPCSFDLLLCGLDRITHWCEVGNLVSIGDLLYPWPSTSLSTKKEVALFDASLPGVVGGGLASGLLALLTSGFRIGVCVSTPAGARK